MASPTFPNQNQPQMASPLAVKFEISQLSRPFRKLSPELRNTIFDYVLMVESGVATIDEIKRRFTEPYKKSENVHTPLALLQTCRLVYIETHKTALQFCTIPLYTMHNSFPSLMDVDGDDGKLVQMQPWQRMNLQKVHICRVFYPTVFPSPLDDSYALITTIGLLPEATLQSLTTLHMSFWRGRRQDQDDMSWIHHPTVSVTASMDDYALKMGKLYFSRLRDMFPSLRQVILEFRIGSLGEDLRDRIICPYADKINCCMRGGKSVLFGLRGKGNLIFGMEYVQDQDWVTMFNGTSPPGSMEWRGVRWTADSTVPEGAE